MRKFTFLRKKIEAKDRASQERLVQNYFDSLNLSEQKADAEFDRDAVYNRIMGQIDTMPVRQKTSRKGWIAFASVIAVMAIAILSYQYKNRLLDVVSPIAQKQLVTTGAQVASLTLADGTKIWLNGGSTLSYPETFRGDKREITLRGEAFLEVAHNAGMAFIVHTGKVSTQVLGTSFNLKAYDDESVVKVDVATGKVGVMAPAQKTVFLTPMQEVSVDKKTNIAISIANVDVATLSSWKDGSFEVKNMPLPEVLSTIRRRFGVTVKADGNLAKCSITANFTNVSLQNVMKIISRLVKGKATASADGSSYELKGRGC